MSIETLPEVDMNDGPETGTSSSGNAQFFSLSDLQSQEEIVLDEFNHEVDANAPGERLPCGTYKMAVNWPTDVPEEERFSFRHDKNGNPYLATMVECEVIAGPGDSVDYAGRKLKANINTIMRKNRTSGVQAFLQAAGKHALLMGGPNTAQRQMSILSEVINQGVILPAVVVDWQARLVVDNVEKVSIRGRRRMQLNANGEPVVIHEGQLVPVYAFVDRWNDANENPIDLTIDHQEPEPPKKAAPVTKTQAPAVATKTINTSPAAKAVKPVTAVPAGARPRPSVK